MTTNDVMRRVRFIFDLSDTQMIELFAHTGVTVTRAQISDWLKKDEDPNYVDCSDTELALFLNGLIIEKRGRKDGPQPEPESKLTNNIIFIKLKIALNLKAEDVLNILNHVDFWLSKHELSAFFRKPGHKHFRECKDQILRNFLNGLQVEYRGDAKTADSPWG
ncbi:MAG: DUF1456 family protein [Bacteroidetes Order II. Incertae sedis bacterium]|jgi:uncharacterized protein YehS (DUF1456 family)|nr:DUF1456 family protein [Bacteroidetes Order II. bacterium]MDG1753842.1 DUF1456 family protein [Rhodothermales bacterium]MBT4052872.1 DUF1456 family protein [Bacteroidetes Order II. bacterium]MBT4602751.1 DUF1456 family protein [Bacteroidetes Order II. bacterium]MBT5250739.1 DUF1456 family protein [Bacteroidetes Order II. bacterium]